MGIIGTRFSTIPGDFEQGLQEVILKKLIQNGQKRLNVDTLITLINVQLKLEKFNCPSQGAKLKTLFGPPPPPHLLTKPNTPTRMFKRTVHILESQPYQLVSIIYK